MTTDERLALIRRRLIRANQHIEQLVIEHESFVENDPYRVERKINPETREETLEVISIAETPDVITDIAADALHNLRSALDHLMYQLVDVSGNIIEHGARCQFPIYKDAATYAKQSSGRIEGARKNAKDAIAALCPYKGGDDLLWTLDELNNRSKHRTLVTVAAAGNIGEMFRSLTGTDIWVVVRMGDTEEFRPQRIGTGEDEASPGVMIRHFRCPLNEGDILHRTVRGPALDEEVHFAPLIALNEPGVCECKPIQHMFLDLSAHVESIISSFEPFLAP